MLSLKKKIFFVLVTNISFFLTLELLARFFYQTPWQEKLMQEQSRNQRIHSHFQKNKPREDFRPRLKTPKEKRILILGDSFTYGQGIPKTENTFPAILEKNLGHLHKKSVTIFNGGLPGSLTKQWVELYDQIKESFQPDIVLIVFSLRNGTLTSQRQSFFGPIRQKIVRRNRSSFIYRHSFLFRSVRDAIDRRAIEKRYTQALLRAYNGSEKQIAEWKRAQENILKVKRHSEQDGSKMGLVIFPILVNLQGGHYPFSQISERIQEFSKASHIPTLDLLPFFQAQNEKADEFWISPLDQHPNEKAHIVAAAAIEPFLNDLLEPSLESQ